MISFKNVTKRFKRQTALAGLQLDIPKGRIVTLIGPSGCGKTTTLKMINRLIEPTSGAIYVNGEDIAAQDVIALRRGMGFAIQHVGLFPHMTVRENIEIIARVEKQPDRKIEARTMELMDMVGLDKSMLDRFPGQLSGGQQQRVGVARAFALDPEIILMDEPFSALDPMTRSALQDELASIQEQVRKTIVFVTHDMDEAIRVGDLICIMRDGHVLQYDEPEAILRNPADDFVTEFIGRKRIMPTPESIPAGDVMSERVVTCPPSLSLGRCLDRMIAENAEVMYVTEPHSRVLRGVLTLEALRGERDRTKTASAIMQRDFVSVTAKTPITEVVQELENNGLMLAPVLSEDGRLLGVISRNRLFATLSCYYSDTEDCDGIH